MNSRIDYIKKEVERILNDECLIVRNCLSQINKADFDKIVGRICELIEGNR